MPVCRIVWKQGTLYLECVKYYTINTLRPDKNVIFADNVIKSFLIETFSNMIETSQKYVPNRPVDNISALLQQCFCAKHKKAIICRHNDPISRPV